MRVPRIILFAGLAMSIVIGGARLVNASSPVKVAILDSGSNIAYKQGLSLIDGTLKDYNGHGTLMASIVKEIYPEAELYIVKVVGRDGLIINEEAVILGLEWAISKNVDVLNLSLRLKDSERLHQMIKKAHNQGIVIIAAAGNTCTRMDLFRAYVQEQDKSTVEGISLTEVAYPAKYSEVIAVGALDKKSRVYEASIKGEEIDVFCQGYKGKNAGTSIASAYATGFAAKIISENPNSSIQKIREILQEKSQRGEL